MRILTAVAMAAVATVSGCVGGSDRPGTVAEFQSFVLTGSLADGVGVLSLLPTGPGCLDWPTDGQVTSDGVTFKVVASGGGVTSESYGYYIPVPNGTTTTCSPVGFAASCWAPTAEASTLEFKDSTKTLDLQLHHLGAARVATPAATHFQSDVMVHCQVPATDSTVVARFIPDDLVSESTFESEAKQVSGGQADLHLVARSDVFRPTAVSGRVVCVSTVAPDACPFSFCAFTVVGAGTRLTVDALPADAGPGTDGGADGGLQALSGVMGECYR